MDYINNAEGKLLYESLFSETGNREAITIEDWTSGWPAIVGGVNGIPTSRQFNTLQYITDKKFLYIYGWIQDLWDAIGKLQEVTGNGSGNTMTENEKGGFIYVGGIDSDIDAGDTLFILTGYEDNYRKLTGGLIHIGNVENRIAKEDVMFVVEDERVTLEMEGGFVYIGAKGTLIRPRGVLFIVDSLEKVFQEARITNLVVDTEPDRKVKNWGFVEGKLTVAQNSETDTTFYSNTGGKTSDGK